MPNEAPWLMGPPPAGSEGVDKCKWEEAISQITWPHVMQNFKGHDQLELDSEANWQSVHIAEQRHNMCNSRNTPTVTTLTIAFCIN